MHPPRSPPQPGTDRRAAAIGIDSVWPQALQFPRRLDPLPEDALELRRPGGSAAASIILLWRVASGPGLRKRILKELRDLGPWVPTDRAPIPMPASLGLQPCHRMAHRWLRAKGRVVDDLGRLYRAEILIIKVVPLRPERMRQGWMPAEKVV